MLSTNQKILKEPDRKKSAKQDVGVTFLPDVSGILSGPLTAEETPKKVSRKVVAKKSIKYKATQVIERGGIVDLDKIIPVGTKMIGRLISSIDTREKGQIVQVLLPFGGKAKGGAKIPKNSIIFGKARHAGSGDKVFIDFDSGTTPESRPFKLKAQALSSKDYSLGLTGEFHGKAGSRLAATLGLTMVAGMADVLTEKEALNDLGAVSPKATLKNALYQGLGQASQAEAARQAGQLAREPEYVTVESGKDLIINLTEAYTSE